MKRIKFLMMFLVAILLFGACSKDEKNQADDYFVTSSQAIDFAKANLKNTVMNQKNVLSKSTDFIPLNTVSLNDDFKKTALHIVNFRSGGKDYFNIVSADSRISHVLAFGEGIINLEDIKEGVDVWIREQIKVIKGIRDRNLTKLEVMTDVLQARELPEGGGTNCCPACPNYPECLFDADNPNPVGCGASVDCDSSNDPCASYNQTITVGPLMTTRWGQGCFYNNNCPIMGCNQPFCQGWGGNRALTGCVATAMAQIIRHHEHPAGYDYANMLDDYNSVNFPTFAQVNAVAELMSDAGTEVSMIYGCGLSGVPVNIYCGEVTNAFLSFFDYSQALGCTNLNNFTHSTIRNEIDNNRPVIFSGRFNQGNGHAWVSDGYMNQTNCYTGTDYQGNTILYLSYNKMYHMNWGWDGFGNGWFDYSTWGGLFNTNQQVIHHIMP